MKQLGDPIKINTKDGRGVQTNTSSKFYSNQYEAGNVANQSKDGSYNLKDDVVYDAGTIDDINIDTKIDPLSIGSFTKEFKKKNPFDKYSAKRVNEYITQQKNAPKWAQLSVNEEELIPYIMKQAEEEYVSSTERYVAKKILKAKPFNSKKTTRSAYLDTLTEEEERLVKQYDPSLQSSYWDDTKRGFQAMFERHPLQTAQNILSDPKLSNREKSELLLNYKDHPMLAKLGDLSKILSPLSVGSKVIQSIYRPDYTFGDAIKGTKNEAGLIEDIVTDPTTYVGIGLAAKVRQSSRLGRALGRLEKITGKANNFNGSVLTDIHDVRLKYHNGMYLFPEEIEMLRLQGKGNVESYKNIDPTNIDDKTLELLNYTPKSVKEDSITDIIFGKPQQKIKIPDNNIDDINVTMPNKDVTQFVNDNNNIIINPLSHIKSLINKHEFTYKGPYERTIQSRLADKWLTEWFTNPLQKQKFIEYGGTEKRWEQVIKSLENPIRGGKTFPNAENTAGIYIGGKINKASINSNVPVLDQTGVGVHEGGHKTNIIQPEGGIFSNDKIRSLLPELYNDLVDAANLTPSETYPEILRMRYNEGWNPNTIVTKEMLETGLSNLDKDGIGYLLRAKVKDFDKLLEVINKAPAIAPIAGAGAAGAAALASDNEEGGIGAVAVAGMFLSRGKGLSALNKLKNKALKTAKNFEDLKYAADFAKKYGYELPDDLNKIASSSKKTDMVIRGIMQRHNSFARGVTTDFDNIKSRMTEEEFKVFDEKMTNAIGNDWQNNPEAFARYALTVPADPVLSSFGRVGLRSQLEFALYTSNSFEQAYGYARNNGYYAKLRKDLDFSSKNRKDWVDKNDFNIHSQKEDELSTYRKLPEMQRIINDADKFFKGQERLNDKILFIKDSFAKEIENNTRNHILEIEKLNYKNDTREMTDFIDLLENKGLISRQEFNAAINFAFNQHNNLKKMYPELSKYEIFDKLDNVYKEYIQRFIRHNTKLVRDTYKQTIHELNTNPKNWINKFLDNDAKTIKQVFENNHYIHVGKENEKIANIIMLKKVSEEDKYNEFIQKGVGRLNTTGHVGKRDKRLTAKAAALLAGSGAGTALATDKNKALLESLGIDSSDKN